MVGNWVDFLIIALMAFGIIKGFRRGLIREVFSLVGSLVAVVLAYQGYQELSWHLVLAYPLTDWQAQLIAFFVLVLGISLLAAFFGFFWSRVIRITPFAILDNLAGAGFGVMKIAVLIIVCFALLGSLGIPPVDSVLEASLTAQQVTIIWPVMHQKLEDFWPLDWPKPGWLFPATSQNNQYRNLVKTPLVYGGV